MIISKNLSDKAMEQFEKGKINKSAALILSSLPEPEQDVLVDEGKTTMKAIKEHKEHSIKQTQDDSDNICETDVINIPTLIQMVYATQKISATQIIAVPQKISLIQI